MTRSSKFSDACHWISLAAAFVACFCLCVDSLSAFQASTEFSEPLASSVNERHGIALISADAPPAAFAAGPVSRSEAIAGDATLNDISCVGTRCWAVGERGVIAHSTDAGLSWSTSMLPFECSLQSVCFLTHQLGWVAGTRFHPFISGRSQAMLLQTRDGGRTWNHVADETMASSNNAETFREAGVSVAEIPGFLKIAYFGLDEAVAVTLPVARQGNATLLRTTDGGRLWTAIPGDNRTSRFTSGSFANAEEGVVAGEMQAFATVVAERAVTIGRPLPTLKQIRGTHLSPSGSAWLVGDAAFLLHSENFGVTWKSVDLNVLSRPDQLLDFSTVAQKDSVVLIAGAPGGVMLRSAYSGRTWGLRPTASVGEIRRISFVSDHVVLALGSMGAILRSEDSGHSWSTVRSRDYRSGLLNLVTELRNSPWELIAANSGDAGIRTITVQVSPRLIVESLPTGNSLSVSHQMQQSRQVMSQLGANDVVSEWSFPRNRPDHELSMSQLISEWNQQTDGELRRMLPLRLARLIRMWQPTVIVVESTCDDDAVAGLLRDALPEAVRNASSDQSEIGSMLSSLFLHPWTVPRIVTRCSSDRTTPLAWRRTDLLPSCGTTIGLLTNVARNQLAAITALERPLAERVCYEVVPPGEDSVTPASLFHGLHSQLNSRAKRSVSFRSSDDLQQLQELAKAAEIQNSAVIGHLRLASTENSMIAQLGQLGSHLPQSLALQQLRELAEMNQQTNDIEGYLAVLQQIIRRFPSSPDAVAAAETLFLYYSSLEVRKYRFNQMQRRSEESDRQRRVSPLGIVDSGSTNGQNSTSFGTNIGFPGAGSADTSSEESSSGFAVSPRIERASTVTFGGGAADHAGTLLQKWDRQASIALQLLQSRVTESLSTSVVLRQAANARLAHLHGEHSSLLAEAAARGDEKSVFALTESQATHGAPGSSMRIVNIQKTSSRPRLDAVLNDACWESAEEIFLTSDPILSSGLAARTLVMISWDDEFLYVAALMEELPNSPPREPLALNRAHDASHGARDRLELEFDVDRDYSTSFRFCVDQTGQTSESCYLLRDWDPQWYAAVDNDHRSWRLELAIPLQELNLQQTRAGDLWSIQLRRIVPGHMRQTLTANADATTAGDRTAADDQGFGLIRFIRRQSR